MMPRRRGGNKLATLTPEFVQKRDAFEETLADDLPKVALAQYFELYLETRQEFATAGFDLFSNLSRSRQELLGICAATFGRHNKLVASLASDPWNRSLSQLLQTFGAEILFSENFWTNFVAWANEAKSSVADFDKLMGYMEQARRARKAGQRNGVGMSRDWAPSDVLVAKKLFLQDRDDALAKASAASNDQEFRTNGTADDEHADEQSRHSTVRKDEDSNSEVSDGGGHFTLRRSSARARRVDGQPDQRSETDPTARSAAPVGNNLSKKKHVTLFSQDQQQQQKQHCRLPSPPNTNADKEDQSTSRLQHEQQGQLHEPIPCVQKRARGSQIGSSSSFRPRKRFCEPPDLSTVIERTEEYNKPGPGRTHASPAPREGEDCSCATGSPDRSLSPSSDLDGRVSYDDASLDIEQGRHAACPLSDPGDDTEFSFQAQVDLSGHIKSTAWELPVTPLLHPTEDIKRAPSKHDYGFDTIGDNNCSEHHNQQRYDDEDDLSLSGFHVSDEYTHMLEEPTLADPTSGGGVLSLHMTASPSRSKVSQAQCIDLEGTAEANEPSSILNHDANRSRADIEKTIHDLAPEQKCTDTCIFTIANIFLLPNAQIIQVGSLSDREWSAWAENGKPYRIRPSTDHVLVFLHRSERLHWVLLVFNLRRRTVSILDTAQSAQDMQVMEHISDLIAPKLGLAFGTYRIISTIVPQQPNDFDCGIYVLVLALYVMANLSLPLTINGRIWRLLFRCVVRDHAAYSVSSENTTRTSTLSVVQEAIALIETNELLYEPSTSLNKSRTAFPAMSLHRHAAVLQSWGRISSTLEQAIQLVAVLHADTVDFEARLSPTVTSPERYLNDVITTTSTIAINPPEASWKLSSKLDAARQQFLTAAQNLATTASQDLDLPHLVKASTKLSKARTVMKDLLVQVQERMGEEQTKLERQKERVQQEIREADIRSKRLRSMLDSLTG